MEEERLDYDFSQKKSIVSQALSWLSSAATMTWGSRVAKLRLRDRFLDTIPWRGDE